MSTVDPEELESLLEDGRSAERRQAFRDAARASSEWDRRHPVGLEATLAWIDELRKAFGDPPVDRRPWRGDDFRL